MEKWKTIEGFDMYAVSNTGLIKSLRRNSILTGSISGKGYIKVNISNKNVKKSFRVHRLVAMHFCEGRTEERCYVNHKNGIKHDNNSDNLEWVTTEENNEHSRVVLKNSNHVPVVNFDKNGVKISSYNSITDAVKSGCTLKYIMSESEYSVDNALVRLRKPRKKIERVADYSHFYDDLIPAIIKIVIDDYRKGFNAHSISKRTGISWYKVDVIIDKFGNK